MGRSGEEVRRKAANGDLADAMARLGACGADPELIVLTRKCLAAEPADRPRDAQQVADGISAYLVGVQNRLQAAERDRAVAVAKAIEERRRRKVQLALAASVLALTTLGGLSTTYYLQQRQARAAAVERVVGQTNTLLEQANAQPEDVSRWQVALASVDQAEAGGDPAAQDRLMALHTEIEASLNAAQGDRMLLDRVVDIRSAGADDPDGSRIDDDYAAAFRAAGIDLTSLSPAEVGARIKARPPSVSLALAGALDDWAATLRSKRKDAATAASLSEAARAADPDPWRTDLRNALDLPDQPARLTRLRVLETAAKYDELGPISLHLLGAGLNEAGDYALAESVLRKAQKRHPGDVWVNFELARALERQSRVDESVRFYTAARALRPETAHELAHALEKRGDLDEAIDVFRDLAELRPDNARHLLCLGRALKKAGRPDAGKALEAAAAAGREEVRLKPGSVIALSNLGAALLDKGELDEAIACYEKAIALDPKDNIVLNNLGSALNDRGRVDEAITCYRKAIALDPKEPGLHYNLGNVLRGKGELNEAIACYEKAIALDPWHASAHFNLGITLSDRGQLDEAIACYEKALALDPRNARAHNSLGIALQDKGQFDRAIASLHRAIELDPKTAEIHCNLGHLLTSQGRFTEALAALRRGHELGIQQPGWRYPSAEWIREAEEKVALEAKLPALRNGDYQPSANAERLALAEMCHPKKLHRTGTSLYTAAFAADPKLGEDLAAGHRYSAACSAALAAAGMGDDAGMLENEERARLRQQALDWLKADLALSTLLLRFGPPAAQPFIAKTLNHWQQTPDLASLRDAAALAKLPAAEQKAWNALWADVAALLKQAEAAIAKKQEK